MRLLILWSEWAGYLHACIQALAGRKGVEVLLVITPPNMREAPYDLDSIEHDYELFVIADGNATEAVRRAEAFAPDIILCCGWRNPLYRNMLRRFRHKAVRVLCMDNQWRNHPRQWLMLALMRLFRRFFYDKAFVPGPRQVAYARYMGFADNEVRVGMYSCDHARFAPGAAEPENSPSAPRFMHPSFLYVGRLSPEKGILPMLEGYRIHVDEAPAPWPLHVCGTGPLEDLVRATPGVVHHGFVQPRDLPGIMRAHTTLLLPSRFEPWGVVIHEAASAGMSIICTRACGASDMFVNDGENGLLLPEATPQAIADAMHRLSASKPDELHRMSRASSRLARQLTPDTWADTVLDLASSPAAARRPPR